MPPDTGLARVPVSDGSSVRGSRGALLKSFHPRRRGPSTLLSADEGNTERKIEFIAWEWLVGKALVSAALALVSAALLSAALADGEMV